MAGQTGTWVARDGAGNGTTAKGARLALGGTLAHNGASPLDVRKGVLVDGGGPVVSGTGSMAYSVRAFCAVTMATTANGPVVLANDSAVTVTTTSAPGSNSRYDVVWVRPHLIAGDGGSDTDVITEIGVTQGAVAASPAVPAIPTGALSLGSALVTAGATSTASLTFTRTHDWTVANGGIIPDGLGGGTFFDGTIWRAIIAYPAAGWTSLGHKSGYQSPGFGYTPAYMTEGRFSNLRGATGLVTGNIAAGMTVTTLPASICPSESQYFVTQGTGASLVSLQISPAGLVNVKAVSGTSNYVTLDGIRISL